MIQNQRGNVVFLLFITLGLFAALSAVVSQSGSTGGNTITKEQANLAASEILQHANTLKQTVQNLILNNNCSENDISFENPIVSGYEHSPDVADKCKVFNADGGALLWVEPDPEYIGDVSSSDVPDTWHITGKNCIDGVGTTIGACLSSGGSDDTDDELVVFLPVISTICEAIVDKLYNSSSIPSRAITSGLNTEKFTGTYANSKILNFVSNPQDDQPVGCFVGTDSLDDIYIFYQTLHAR